MFPLAALHTATLSALLLVGGCALMPKADEDLTGPASSARNSLAADYVDMGVEYLKRGQPTVALERLKRGQELDPNYAPLYNVLAILYEQLGESDRARENFTRAIQLAPKDPYIRNAYGTFLCNQKEYPAAEVAFQAALENPLNPTPWVANTNAGICARQAGDTSRAETYFRQSLSVNSDFEPALYQMAELSYAQGNLSGAKDYLQRLLRTTKPNAEILALGVRVERGLGNTTQARRYEQVLREQFPDSPEIPKLNQP